MSPKKMKGLCLPRVLMRGGDDNSSALDRLSACEMSALPGSDSSHRLLEEQQGVRGTEAYVLRR